MLELIKRKAARLLSYGSLKRLLDCVLAGAGLFLCLPLFFLVSLGIRCSSPGPILFRQVRMGRSLEPFLLYKFRTMSCRAPHDAATATLAGAGQYITRFGAFLRATSLDELPQLLNVLRGDMSMLGPRPVVLEETELIARRAAVGAYRVRPGISGLAQVRGRDLLGDEEKARMDGLYAAQLSFLGDLRLFFDSLVAVLLRRDIREGREEPPLS